MRIAIAIIIFIAVLVTGPLWFAGLLGIFPSESLEFMSGFITVFVAAAAAGTYWWISSPRDDAK
ncbi:hypothetical protein QP027_02800 [Corynebacterium breve]|uniref:Uncharacterized protein n=1 Tax=Corynebacterium breve TaxID=3049799 RepID=A0ABY8VJH1_9CORY|nr:hypothetical protein [Corynebacterium breve]WIM68344.1 hypothetical protein QP027_02800 [Corynebacterium breve]